MPKRIRVTLSEDQRRELEQARDRHKKGYVRVRAAAILKVADGAVVSHVAEHGLLKRHEPETVSGWIKRYLAEGLEGLEVRPGAGRQPSFSPSGERGGSRGR